MFPDIIIHCRGNEDLNLLAVEIKKTSNKRERRFDTLKLQSFREEMGYKYTTFLELGVKGRAGENIEPEWGML